MVHFLAYLVLALLVCGTSTMAGEKYCMGVFREFLPCVNYVGGISSKPSKGCCVGITSLNKKAKLGRGHVKMICQCIEDMAYVMKFSMIAPRIGSLQQECHQHNNFPISTSLDCFK